MFSANIIRRGLATLALGVALVGFAQMVPSEAQGQRPSLGLLQGQINQLEAENNAQQAEIDALSAEADTAPIVVDSTGEVLGAVLDATKDDVDVLFDLPGLPLFVLQVLPQEIEVQGVTLWFESADCTGQAWVNAPDVQGVMGMVVAVPGSVPLPPAGRTFYVADPLDSPEMIFRLSWDQNDGFRQPADVGEVSAKRVTPLDLDSLFTPPFRVTTRERMQAQP